MVGPKPRLSAGSQPDPVGPHKPPITSQKVLQPIDPNVANKLQRSPTPPPLPIRHHKVNPHSKASNVENRTNQAGQPILHKEAPVLPPRGENYHKAVAAAKQRQAVLQQEMGSQVQTLEQAVSSQSEFFKEMNPKIKNELSAIYQQVVNFSKKAPTNEEIVQLSGRFEIVKAQVNNYKEQMRELSKFKAAFDKANLSPKTSGNLQLTIIESNLRPIDYQKGIGMLRTPQETVSLTLDKFESFMNDLLHEKAKVLRDVYKAIDSSSGFNEVLKNNPELNRRMDAIAEKLGISRKNRFSP